MAKIKICGIRRMDDIEYVNAALPDYIGFVFAPSKRQVTKEQATRLRRELDPRITPVGVFVNADIADIAVLYHDGIIQIAQLHGGESEEYIKMLKEECGVSVIQAIRHGQSDKIVGCVDYVLFDAKAGGSGITFDWRDIPECGKPWFLAGGIATHNIDAALSLRPFAVDCSSGSETDGIKDETKIYTLVSRVRNEV